MEIIQVAIGETDLHIQVPAGTAPLAGLRSVAEGAVRGARQAITTEGLLRPLFLTSLVSLEPRPSAPAVVVAMYRAAADAGVGPMAAVAGAIAEHVGRVLLEHLEEAIVENGGDVFLSTCHERVLAVHAGRSALSGRLGVVVPAGQALGVCTSSGTVGPSYSAGRADAALIAAGDAAHADAMASALGNRVHGPQDAGPAVEWAVSVAGVRQALVIVGDTLAVAGELEIRRL